MEIKIEIEMKSHFLFHIWLGIKNNEKVFHFPYLVVRICV